uniref:Uncharacterized protein n=1 Tax=Ditylenchus dipsaci TaxID=166011 RepID=A0A915EGS1_9BILA
MSYDSCRFTNLRTISWIFFLIEQRLTIEECIVQEWLQDAEVYADLLKLEQRLGVPRYLTSEQDDLRFGTELQRLGVGALI